MRNKGRQILSRTNRANDVNNEFIIWLLVHFIFYFATLFLSSEFAVTNPVSFFVSILVYTNLAFIYRVFKQTALKKTSSNVQAHSIVRNI